MGHSKSSAVSPFDGAHTTSYSTLIETTRLCCTVFEIKPAICRKSPILTHLTCIWRPHKGWYIPVEFRGDLWRQKTRIPGLSCGVIYVIICLAVLVEHWLGTDRQTDGQTNRETDGRTKGHSIYRACLVSRGKNNCQNTSLNLDVATVIFHIKHVSFEILHTFQGHLGH